MTSIPLKGEIDMLGVPEAFRKFNVPQVERLQIMRDRANTMNKQAHRLKGGMFYVFFSRTQALERKGIHEEVIVVELALVELDAEIIDFYRVTPEPGEGPNIGPQWFALQMRVRSLQMLLWVRISVQCARAWPSYVEATQTKVTV